jgi:transposase-like protein
MSEHHSEDYKLSAISYYLDNDKSLREVSEIFGCSKTSLGRWVNKYINNNSVSRKFREYK